MQTQLMSLEETLEGAEKRAQELLESTRKLQRQAAAAVKMIRTGDLKGLRKTLALLEETRRQTESGLDEVRRSWSWSEQQEEQYVASEAFAQELLEQGRKQGVGIYRQESVLACYPSLVRVLPRDRAVRVDKKSVREIRPSYLIERLGANQKRAPKLNAQSFLETLLAAYNVRTGGKRNVMERLIDLYDLLTLLPSSRKDYGLQEFARDVYLLDGSGVKTTRDGSQFRLNAGATASKNRSNLLVVITREGVERTYFGIEFN